MRTVLLRILPALLLVLLVTAATGNAQPNRENDITRVVAETRDAIVNLRTLSVIPTQFDNSRVRGLGTGVVIDPRGYVVTNYHVVENVTEIKALTASKETFQARVLKYDAYSDLAILKIDSGRDLDYLSLWEGGETILGETVIAIGNPYGLDNTISTGIVSAVGRTLDLPNGKPFHGLIQTDASINPGNSGGPLLNIEGNLIGINVAIRSHARGIGFAIPTNQLRRIVEGMMGKPATVLASYGVMIDQHVPVIQSASSTNRQPAKSVRLGFVNPDSEAHKAGFRTGDELMQVAGQSVRMSFDLDRILWERNVGESLDFRVRRYGGKTLSITLTLPPPPPLTDAQVLWQFFGVRVDLVPAEKVRKVNPRWRGGLLLREVAPNSAAAQAGFRPGDILCGLHGWETIDLNNVRYVMEWRELQNHQPIEYHLIRDGSQKSGRIYLPRHIPPR